MPVTVKEVQSVVSVLYSSMNSLQCAASYLRGPGGVPTLGFSKSIFLLFMIEGSPSYKILFTESKILILAKVIVFSNLDFTGNYTIRANFNHALRKTQNLAAKS